jgi:hypothetical protein
VKMGKVLSLTTTKMTIAGTEEMIKSLFIPWISEKKEILQDKISTWLDNMGRRMKVAMETKVVSPTINMEIDHTYVLPKN